jgi:hypothetical protein
VRNPLSFAIFLLAISCIISCASGGSENQLSAQQKKNGWKLLFDGKTLNGWHLYHKRNKASVWEAKNGELSCNPGNGKEEGDLVTDSTFENFDLTFEWRMGDDGNSGVFINVLESDTLPRVWFSGPEYQLLGNANRDFPVPDERSGALFGLDAQKNEAAVKPVDQWNQSRIKQVGGKTEFYLNDVLTVKEDFTSQAWLDKVRASNFKTHPDFGKYTKGHIALQDWAKGVSFRNIRVKNL